MIPATDPSCAAPGGDERLHDPRDVEFVLNALLGPPADAARRAALATGLPQTPTLLELVDAVFARLGTEATGRRRREAQRLLGVYFLLDPPLPPEPGGPS